MSWDNGILVNTCILFFNNCNNVFGSALNNSKLKWRPKIRYFAKTSLWPCPACHKSKSFYISKDLWVRGIPITSKLDPLVYLFWSSSESISKANPCVYLAWNLFK